MCFITGIDETRENDNEEEDTVNIKQSYTDENRVLGVNENESEASATSLLQYVVSTISSLLDHPGNFIDLLICRFSVHVFVCLHFFIFKRESIQIIFFINGFPLYP